MHHRGKEEEEEEEGVELGMMTCCCLATCSLNLLACFRIASILVLFHNQKESNFPIPIVACR